MKRIVDIPEEIMEYIKNNGCLSVIYIDKVAEAIKNGIPLSEELKKIKEENFNKQNEFTNNLLSECNVRYGLDIAEIIVDNHISELKGE